MLRRGITVALGLIGTVALYGCSSGHKNPDPFLQGSPQVATSGPIQVLVEGDSLALTLGFGLSSGQAAYNLNIADTGEMGCGITAGDPMRFQGQLDYYIVSDKNTFINDFAPRCNVWQKLWADNVTTYKPDVVAILVGRWEVVDRMHDGQMMSIGTAAYDAYISQSLEQAVRICAAHGARVVLVTMPYLAPSPYPESAQSRTDQFNALLKAVATKYPSWVSVYDLNRVLDPNGTYTPSVNGVETRILTDVDGNPDGSHISVAGDQLIAPTLDPLLQKLGSQARAAAAG